MMKRILTFFPILMILSGLISCTLSEQSLSPIEETQAALFAQATLTSMALQTEAAQPEPEQPTETLIPPTATVTATQTASQTPESTSTFTFTYTPTITPSLTSTQAPPAGERIYFANNATQFFTEGTTSQIDSKVYIVNAGKDQLMDITVTSGSKVAISVVGADGTVLQSPMGESPFFRGVLPASQDYLITVRTTAASANFSITIMIPVRIVFGAGENTYAVSAPAIPGDTNRHYSIYALSGQTLSVDVEPTGDFALTIYGQDGTILMGSHDHGSSFSGTLPSTQNYIISVQAAPGVSSGYSLTVTVN
jgi:hypothetical protein